jgi:uncharacterized protein YcnI
MTVEETVREARGLAARRVAAVIATAGVALLGVATPAAAHVRVDGGAHPEQGGYGVVRLLVPSESDTASTVGLTVTIPDGVDLKSARTLPIPGWTATVDRATANGSTRVTRVTWRAVDPANGVKPTEFGEFTFSAGPWPKDVLSVPLSADQSYSDGATVSWNEVAVDEDSEPEHPAPVVVLADAEDSHANADAHGGAATQASSGSGSHHSHDGAEATGTAAESSDSQDVWWQAISVVALVIALGAVAGLVVVLRRDRGKTN